MSDWDRQDGYNKRRPEQTLQVASKRHHTGDVNPGREYVEPRVYQQPNYTYDSEPHQGTDFSTWSEADIKAFLDQRGGDFDDCTTHQQLVDRAIETEINTGPARRPSPADDPTASAAAETGNGSTALPAAPAAPPAATTAAAASEEEEYDPLEAFMAEVNQEVAENKPNKPAGAADIERCDDVADPATEYMEVRAAQAKTSAAAIAASIAAEGYDSDEEVYATAKALQGEGDDDLDVATRLAQSRNIDPLAPVDHSLIEYDDFAKDFYTEHPSITAMTDQQMRDLRRELDIHVSGFDPPRPIKTFGQAGFDHLLLGAIKKAGYEAPTAIQAQALPAALAGRDVLGLAKTGSGKTAAFVLPMLVHIMDQPELGKGQGPIGLVLAPTRELAEQIHRETRKFSKPYGLSCVAAFGGLSKFEQFKDLKAGSEIAVATPGRMMDLLRMKACTATRVTYLVLDEADRMFDMGFGEQVHSLLNVVRPDRQTLLFSATLPRKIEALVAEALSNPVRISVGLLGAANADIAQRVEIMKDDAAKLAWLRERLPGFIDDGDVLCFVGQRAKAEEVTQALHNAGFRAVAIHGDMDQFSRMEVLDSFRSGKQHLLIATDVAARGLDIKSIKTVINYDAARDIDTHIHRVGRTGRAGDKEGVAYTLLLGRKDAHFAGLLVNSLSLGGQEVPRELHELAMNDNRFRRGNSRHKGGKGGQGGARHKGPRGGGAGLGFGDSAKFIPQSSAQAAAASAAAGAGHMPPGNIISGVPAVGQPAAAAAAAPASGGGGGGGDGGFVQLAGFAKSTDDYEHESSAAATAPVTHGLPGRRQQQQQQQGPPRFIDGAFEGLEFPPPPPEEAAPPPLPQEDAPPLPPSPEPVAAVVPAAAAAQPPQVSQVPQAPQQQQQQEVAVPPVQEQQAILAAAKAAAAAAAAAALAARSQQTPAAATSAAAAAEPPQQPQPPPPGSMAAARQELLQAGYAQHMKRGFVSSGVRTGDVGASATIVAAKVPKSSSSDSSIRGSGIGQHSVVVPPPSATVVAPAVVASAAATTASGRPVPRPPIPVTQRPMYLTRPTETITRGPRRPQQAAAAAAPALNSSAAQQAIAAAQAIAQRLAAQAVGVPQSASGSNSTPLGVPGVPAGYGSSSSSSGYPQYPQPPQQQQQYYQAPVAQQQQQQQQEYDPFSSDDAGPAQPQQQQQQGGGGGAYDPVAAAQAFAERLAQKHHHR